MKKNKVPLTKMLRRLQLFILVMNKLIFAIVVTFALTACANIPVTAEQENIAVNTNCQDEAWYLGTLNLTMGSCRIYNLSFVPGEKEITLYVEKNWDIGWHRCLCNF